MKRIHILNFLILAYVSPVFSQNYYISNNGDDNANTGITPDSPWQTISKINSTFIEPGDVVHLENGGVWRETLIPSSSGTPELPITFTSYGNGVPPTITRTNIYNNWWEHSLVVNGGMETFNIGSPNDDFLDLSEYSQGTACSVKADNDVKRSGLSSTRLTCDGNGTTSGNYSRITTYRNLQDNSMHYMSVWGRVDAVQNNGLVLRIKDTCNNKFLGSNGVWQTYSATYAITWNEAPVNTWVQKNIVFQTADTSVCPQPQSYEITYYNFQTSNSWIDDMYLVQGTEPKSERVWAGSLNSLEKVQGAVRNGVRLDRHTGTVDPMTINNGYFYNYSRYFYLRDDSEYPVNVEIGSRARAINVSSKSNLVIENIHATGPAYGNDTSVLGGYPIFGIEGSSSNVIVRNSILTNGNAFGISAANTTTDITYSGLFAHDNGSTGIYMNSQGGKVKNCLSTGNGRLASDFGDRGGIGSYQGGNIKIIGNEVYLNGQDNQDADMEISVVGAIAPITIEKNHVHNCIQGCIQIAEGGDGSVVSYNVINGFGSAVSATPSSSGKWGGIRIGGGTGSAKNVRILNNVILGGLQPNTTSHAGIYVSQFDNPGLILKNNIFYNNASKDVFVHSTGITTGIDFSNNIYYKSDFANNWYWKGSDASSLNEWRSISQLDNASLDVNPLFIDPVNYDFHLGVGSPAINNGVYVGLTTDIDNQAIIGNPDIGAYEDQGPDFLPTSMSAIRSGGNRVYVLDAVFNQGGNSLNSIVINYYLSTDNKFSNDDLQLLCSKTQEILSSGQTSSLIRTTCYKPSNVMRSVNYNVLVMDDASNNVVENNEINNVGVAGVVSW